MPAADMTALRRLVLAVAVLDDVDVEPRDDGVVLPGWRALHVSWEELRDAVGDPRSEERARRRVREHLHARRVLADYPLADLAERARPVGMASGSPGHPGPGWVIVPVPGDALDLGLGFVGVGDDPDRVEVLPPAALAATAVDPRPWWPPAAAYCTRMGELAAARLARDPKAVLRPMGDCDVVTLLGSAPLRAALAARDGTGMAGVAVPMRTRGWTDLRFLDPAFAVAAAAATDEEERGFPRPLLVTADEVVVVPPGGRPAELALRGRHGR